MDEEKRREKEAEVARRAKIKDRIARHKGKEEATRAAKVRLLLARSGSCWLFPDRVDSLFSHQKLANLYHTPDLLTAGLL